MKDWIKKWIADATVVAKVLIIVAIPTGLLTFHVWNQYRITALGYEIAEVTSEHRILLEENKKLVVEARLQGRTDRVTMVAQERFGLQEARPEQVITVSLDELDGGEEHARLANQGFMPSAIR